MKVSPFYRLLSLLMVIVLFSTASCKKNIDKENEDQPFVRTPLDLDEIDIPLNNGGIGVVIDVRSFARKGYQVGKVEVQIEGSLSGYSRTLPVDKLTNVAIFKIKRDSLTTGEIEQFAKGVKTILKIFDEDDKLIESSETPGLTYDETGNPYKVPSALPAIIPELKFSEGIAYYIQEYTPSGETKFLTIEMSSLGNFVHLDAYKEAEEDKSLQLFYFELVQPGMPLYYIRTGNGYYLDYNYSKTRIEATSKTSPNYKQTSMFRFYQDENGFVSIQLYNMPYLKKEEVNITGLPQFPLLKTVLKLGSGEAIKFNFLSSDIKWQVTDMGVSFNDPIFPPVKLDFAFHNLLRNCSAATLEETVGTQSVKTTVFTVGTEESFQLTSTHEGSVGITTGVSANASFGGVGVEASMEVSASYTYTRGVTETTTENYSKSSSDEVVISRERKITILPYTSIKVFDAVENYSNVRIPFVQKLRITGATSSGTPVSGEAMVSQMIANSFGGVVIDVGETYIVITLSGIAHIENLMKVTTSVTDDPQACPGR